ncbi:GNAT family N-acetyltransferase [Acuticoccus mangrovi]|uniref:GNAT family N-acetyltransferase n=1 Tax=Acuticoccus mangrovi TaxID=2796142 RepID=A0A934IQH4_9HYPH|nr:GNAT family N-acetyltransferase [Acuticoccus mangrovi]MBJ3776190.1 GNAT family N-acetyltransferase [Acuticoccus mangrovi]
MIVAADWSGRDPDHRPVLLTDRLRLDLPVRDDAERMARLAGDLDVSRWLARVPHPYRLRDAVGFVDILARQDMVWAIRRRDDERGRLIGTIGLVPLGDDAAEIGYWLGRPEWGHGYATEAATAVVRHAFGPMGLSRLVAGAFEGNERSLRVLEKVGFRRTGASLRHCLALGRELPHIDVAMAPPG